METKTYLNKEKLRLRHILGTYLKSGRYTSYEDALYDVLRYMEEKQSQTITPSSIHYALKLKVDATYVEALMQWAAEQGYFQASDTGKKTVYTLMKSPFK
jgi:deoxyhypusine synthase